MVTVQFPEGEATTRQLINHRDILNTVTPEYTIENIIQENSVAILVGQPGTYKSFIALDWAHHIAAGLPTWNGLKIKNGKVIYYAAEGAGGIGKRAKAWMQEHQVTEVQNFWLTGESINITKDKGTQAIVDEVIQYQPVLVIIDTLSRASLGANENNNSQMAQVMDNAGRIARASGATVLLIHHTRKDGTSFRGAQAILGAIDTMMYTIIEDGKLILHCDRQKDDEEFDDMKFDMKPLADSLVPIYLPSEKFKMTPHDKAVWKLLQSIQSVTSQKEIVLGTGISKASVSRSIKKMLNAAMIRIDEGGIYVI